MCMHAGARALVMDTAWYRPASSGLYCSVSSASAPGRPARMRARSQPRSPIGTAPCMQSRPHPPPVNHPAKSGSHQSDMSKGCSPSGHFLFLLLITADQAGDAHQPDQVLPEVCCAVLPCHKREAWLVQAAAHADAGGLSAPAAAEERMAAQGLPGQLPSAQLRRQCRAARPCQGEAAGGICDVLHLHLVRAQG